jgi:hypothetical protein
MSRCVHRKLPLAERTKAEGSLNYASVFPDWVTHHTIFSSVDSVIRCVGMRLSIQDNTVVQMVTICSAILEREGDAYSFCSAHIWIGTT